LYLFIKRLFDVIASFVGLLVFSPLLLVLAILIKLDSPGPVLYRGTRVGKDGKPFRMSKFRTMVVDADKIGGPSTADDDPRVTQMGRFLRKYKLDELPQLINVFMGEMSLVGPRPEVQHYVDMFTDEEKAILTVRPGITDWASLWNPDEGAILAGAEDPEQAYMELIRPTKLMLQLRYVSECSLRVDLQILWETLKAVILRRQPTVEGAPPIVGREVIIDTS
jgi:lipopolysaccharide/colanic/teichoic acid biosynthesis glycosyltransferase